MNVVQTPLPGVLIFEPKVFRDDRGHFLESFSLERYRAAGLTLPFVQDNWSRSKAGTLRGLHFQNPRPQGKLVMVTRGAVFDVAVDIRKSSPTFGKWFGVELSEENCKQFWIPPGFAHGFVALRDDTDFLYKCTDVYFPEGDGGVLWNDPDLGIAWPVKEPLLSKKDAAAPRLRDSAKLPA
ncbi:MAG: dTDP-4-dehydrorhamnose 3,5-epimerase [Archangiaceae bacterium]|nr:dTDP-4-dehydrorhamnose 3,5-epimerase [Archangiaceae bacterium]